MKLKIQTVLDVKVGSFSNPYFVRSTEEGRRSFGDIWMSNDPQYAQSNMVRHPADFVLFEIGTFDDETGEIASQLPVAIAKGIDFVVNAPQATVSDAEGRN